MGRRKIEIKAIKEERNRSVTFLKRKGGLFKKAHELSVLCSVDIAVIIFGNHNKLYEYSSVDMNEILGRYSYSGKPHEHKGPADFQGKGGLDSDDDMDMGSPPPESHSDHMQHPHIHHPGLPHMDPRRGTSSASPPVHGRNGVYPPNRNGTPQPGISRPSSRNDGPRRVSQSNLNPHSNTHPHQAQVNQSQNGYYMQAPPAFNPPPQHSSMPPNIPSNISSNMGQVQNYQYPSSHPASQAPPQYLQNDDRRSSLPPTFAQPQRQQQPTENSAPMQNEIQPPPVIEKQPTFKSRSIFTPIVGPDSELRNFLFPSVNDSSRESHRKPTPPPIKAMERRAQVSPKQSPPRSAPLPPLPVEPSSKAIAPPPGRSNSLPGAPLAKRPTLTLTIPMEQGDGDAVTAGSSTPDANGPAGNLSQMPPTTRPADAPHGSVVLPPPSPSVTLLSAGATGPINPFAPRPHVNNSIPPDQTPLSALPSRFLPGEMLPSPSTFFSDWGATFGSRAGGGNDNVLPSPLNFQTPINQHPPQNIFKEEQEPTSKRKSPTLDSPEATTASTKKLKV